MALCRRELHRLPEMELINADHSMATSIRVAVGYHVRIAPKNATAFVTKFEKLDTTGTWMASRYSELVQLPWVGETMTVDLSNLFPRFVSVLHIGDDNKIGFWMIGTPFTLVDFLETATKYRLTIVVLAEGRTEPIVTTDQIVIELDWKANGTPLRCVPCRRRGSGWRTHKAMVLPKIRWTETAFWVRLGGDPSPAQR